MILTRWCGLLSLCLVAVVRAADPTLPVYLEDNHAGSFHWLAQHLDLEEEHTLVIFDAHSDASGIFDSDLIRERIRRVASDLERQSVLERWRRDGTIQCFNWIEPLMPAPFANVIWVPGEKLPPNDRKFRERGAREFLDGHLEAAPRKAGSMRERYRVSDFESLRKSWRDGPPLVVTIDLDAFAGLPAERQVAAFERVWRWTIERRNLRAVTMAISRPYLADDAEAHRLVELAIRAALSVPTAALQFEPFLQAGNDHSELAKRLRAAGREVPAYHIDEAPESLRGLLLSASGRIRVTAAASRWLGLLANWSDSAPQFQIAVTDHEPSTDGVWRVSAGEPAQLELGAEPWYAKADEVSWFVLVPAYPSCNMIAANADYLGFAADAPPRPRWIEMRVNNSGTRLDVANLAPWFARAAGVGSIRVLARMRCGNLIRETEPIELRCSRGTGFRAAILEQFGLPYLLGSGELHQGTDTGPETHLGADCANFVIQALRRTGRRIPWSDPKMLRNKLDPLAQGVRPGQQVIDANLLERGLIVHLGSHVAAVMEDRPPLGILDENDIVAHHLEGLPELVPLGRLLRARETRAFDLYLAPLPDHQARVLVAGDTMLGRTVGDRVLTERDPFASVRSELQLANLAIANLECVISDRGLGNSGDRFSLRAPTAAAASLRAAGIHAVGIANNHALDFGAAGLNDMIARLHDAGLSVAGGGKTPDSAYAPLFFQLPGENRVALFAVNAVQGSRTADDGTCLASDGDRPRLAAAINAARTNSNLVICLVHWGDENTSRTTPEQRSFARWLIDAGVDVVVGAHPHCVQPTDFYHGGTIVYSLGNFIFDGAPGVPSWNAGQLLELTLGKKGQLPSTRTLPLSLDDGGIPVLSPSPAPTLTLRASSP